MVQSKTSTSQPPMTNLSNPLRTTVTHLTSSDRTWLNLTDVYHTMVNHMESCMISHRWHCNMVNNSCWPRPNWCVFITRSCSLRNSGVRLVNLENLRIQYWRWTTRQLSWLYCCAIMRIETTCTWSKSMDSARSLRSCWVSSAKQHTSMSKQVILIS